MTDAFHTFFGVVAGLSLLNSTSTSTGDDDDDDETTITSTMIYDALSVSTVRRMGLVSSCRKFS